MFHVLIDSLANHLGSFLAVFLVPLCIPFFLGLALFLLALISTL